MVSISPHVYPALCRTLLGHETSIPWRDFSSSDWQQFARAAQVERVAPLLYHGFRHRGWPVEMPDNVRQILSQEFYNAAANGSLMFSELEHVLLGLEKHGIQVVLLKGAALAVTIYPDVALRPMADLDLLIRPSDLQAAVGVVEALGYTSENPPLRRGLEHLFFYETNFQGGDRSLTHLELHWDLVGGEGSRYRPDIGWFWAQTRPLRVGSAPALVLTPTAHFLHATVHAVLKHGGEATRLLWLYDLHLIIAQCQDLDWNQLVGRAQEFHWAPAVNAVLRELCQLFATPLPAWVLEALGHADDPETEDLVARMALHERSRTSGALKHLAFLDWSSRLRWLTAVVFPDRDYMRWRYEPRHPWLCALYYPVRWADMLRDALSTIIPFSVTRALERKNH